MTNKWFICYKATMFVLTSDNSNAQNIKKIIVRVI